MTQPNPRAGYTAAILMLLAALLFAPGCSRAKADAETPEMVAGAYYRNLKGSMDSAIVAFVHPDALAAFKSRVLAALSRAAGSADSVTRSHAAGFLRGRAIADLAAMSPDAFARAMIVAAEDRPEGVAMHGTLAQVKGSVIDGDDRAYVTVVMLSESIRVDWPKSEAVVVAMRRVGPSWKIDYPDELDTLAREIIEGIGRNTP
jgi:hypothetical protein